MVFAIFLLVFFTILKQKITYTLRTLFSYISGLLVRVDLGLDLVGNEADIFNFFKIFNNIEFFSWRRAFEFFSGFPPPQIINGRPVTPNNVKMVKQFFYWVGPVRPQSAGPERTKISIVPCLTRVKDESNSKVR